MPIEKLKLKVKSLSLVRLFATWWTVAHQAPPSMEARIFRQEYSGKNTGVGCHYVNWGVVNF